MSENIKTVTTFAFVLPVYDFGQKDCEFMFIPTSENWDCVYWVMQWDYEIQAFVEVAVFDTKKEAQAMCREIQECALETFGAKD